MRCHPHREGDASEGHVSVMLLRILRYALPESNLQDHNVLRGMNKGVGWDMML